MSRIHGFDSLGLLLGLGLGLREVLLDRSSVKIMYPCEEMCKN